MGRITLRKFDVVEITPVRDGEKGEGYYSLVVGIIKERGRQVTIKMHNELSGSGVPSSELVGGRSCVRGRCSVRSPLTDASTGVQFELRRRGTRSDFRGTNWSYHDVGRDRFY